MSFAPAFLSKGFIWRTGQNPMDSVLCFDKGADKKDADAKTENLRARPSYPKLFIGYREDS